MPPSWVVWAIFAAARFRLVEVSVPPGSATLEKLAALAPGVADTLVQWARGTGALAVAPAARRAVMSAERLFAMAAAGVALVPSRSPSTFANAGAIGIPYGRQDERRTACNEE